MSAGVGSPNERAIRESLQDPTVPRRGMAGLSSSDYARLSPAERSRLVLVDPYENGRAGRQAAASEEMVELQLASGRRVRVPCGTREERHQIAVLVEDGQAFFGQYQPAWFAGHRTGRFKDHVPGELSRPVPASEVAATHARLDRLSFESARRAQEAYAATHEVSTVPVGGRGMKYRNPYAG